MSSLSGSFPPNPWKEGESSISSRSYRLLLFLTTLISSGDSKISSLPGSFSPKPMERGQVFNLHLLLQTTALWSLPVKEQLLTCDPDIFLLLCAQFLIPCAKLLLPPDFFLIFYHNPTLAAGVMGVHCPGLSRRARVRAEVDSLPLPLPVPERLPRGPSLTNLHCFQTLKIEMW